VVQFSARLTHIRGVHVPVPFRSEPCCSTGVYLAYPSELDLLTHQLAGIVDHLDTLGEVIGLGSAMPSATGDEELRLRDDVALPSWLPHQVVANASAHGRAD
jgi:hypothetical protein